MKDIKKFILENNNYYNSNKSLETVDLKKSLDKVSNDLKPYVKDYFKENDRAYIMDNKNTQLWNYLKICKNNAISIAINKNFPKESKYLSLGPNIYCDTPLYNSVKKLVDKCELITSIQCFDGGDFLEIYKTETGSKFFIIIENDDYNQAFNGTLENITFPLDFKI